MKANIRSVASFAGVSVATVSRVINKSDKVSQETAERVTNAISELDYQLNHVARSLRTNKTNTVGVLLPLQWAEEYPSSIIQGIRKVLQAEGYYIILGSTENTVENELYHIEKMHAHNVDGLIVIPNNSENDYLASKHGTGVPTVFMDRKIKGDYGDCVMCDNYAGAYDAVTALTGKGHKKIGLITNTMRVTTIADRTRGYVSALDDAGIAVTEERILRGETGSYDVGVQMMQKMLKTGDVTAVFFADVTHGVSAVTYANEIGLRIPQDLAVIVFDDLPNLISMKPSMSAVAQPMYEMGLKAAQLIVDRIANPDKSFETCYLAPRLILRESV